MDVSVIHGRTHSRLVNRRQGNSGTRNGSRRVHANHAMIMNEVRCILQVLRQGIDVQRLTRDVDKLRAAGMVQDTVHLGQVSQRDRVRRLNRLGQIFRQDWRVVIRLLVWDKLIVRYMLTNVGQATHHLACIRKTHMLDVHCLFGRLVKLLTVCWKNV
jgi:hypothetical protein